MITLGRLGALAFAIMGTVAVSAIIFEVWTTDSTRVSPALRIAFTGMFGILYVLLYGATSLIWDMYGRKGE